MQMNTCSKDTVFTAFLNEELFWILSFEEYYTDTLCTLDNLFNLI
jgi:hypothetical protein